MNTPPHESMEALQHVAAVLAVHPQIELAYVFGSVALGTARFESDIDVAVQSAAGALGTAERRRLVEDLAAATGRAVDLVDLGRAGKPLLGQVLKHGRRVMGSDASHAALMVRHVFDMEDFVPYVERMLKQRRQAWTG